MPHLIRGSLKDYDWGVVDGLAPWFGDRTGGPQAELWFGAHPSGPAHLLTPRHAAAPLTDGALGEPARTLADVVDSSEVPLLVKILAAARPLSVQVHPHRELAAAAFAAQSIPGAVPVYADPYEKTELLLALTPFTAFCGWREVEDSCALLDGVPGAAPAISALRSGDHRTAVRALLAISDTDAALSALFARTDRHRDAGVFRTVRAEFPADRSALLLALLAVQELQPGDAVYVPAGVPHSYVRGTGVEVMTSSDNVVRLGLTSKAVFIEQALDALSETAHPTLLPRSQGWIRPSGAPFVLHTLDGVSELVVPSGAYRVVLALKDTTMVEVAGATWSIATGQALTALVDEDDLIVRTASADSSAVIVTSVGDDEGSR